MKTILILPRGLLALVLAAVLTVPAPAWWNPDYAIRKKITVDPAAIGLAEAVGAVPVLVRLHDGNFQFAAAKEDGTDIRFIAEDDKTPLPYHLEKFDALMSEGFAWVRLSGIKPGAPAFFWIYYGNAADKGGPGTPDPKETYDGETALVYHFGETNAPARDVTGHGNDAGAAGLPADGAIIGGGLRFDGHKTVPIPGASSLAWKAGAPLTWSVWFKAAALQPNAILFGRGEGASAFRVGVDNGVPFVEAGGRRSGGGSPVATNAWHHLGIVAAQGKMALYLDGAPYGTLDAPLPALDGPATLGGDGKGDFTGELDELEIANTARSADFLKVAALGQGADKGGKFLALGPDEQAASWMTGTFGVLIRSLTPDGWAVIILLVLMSIGSWCVMVSKANFLNGIAKGNSLFMKEWRHIATDLTVLDHGDTENVKSLGGRIDAKGQRALRQASVYRIYHIGAEEIRHRLAASATGEVKYLSGQSIQAIRASLDTGMVKEHQSLNRLMVLLTICISGGPFLGLLGTVVGVMITFAAIAQAGDVNVNAIAPGIAAALLATVAGLAVAIPALFGYNYLIYRIKDATADMHVFADEFVTKMAEFYRPRSD